MRKKRILFCGEATYLNTGYSTYWNEIITRLYKTGKYEIAELGGYGKPDDKEIALSPWKIYPNMPDINDHDAVNDYNSNVTNQFGEWRFEEVCLDFRPDIVCDIRDFWMMEFEERSPFRRFFHWFIMPTVDAAPQHPQWLSTFSSADAVLSYSDWGRNILNDESGGKVNCLDIAPPAAQAAYTPVANKDAHKSSLGLKEDSIIIGTVMRNQRRKLFPDLFSAFGKFLEKSKKTNVYLYCHTTYPDVGWNIPELILKNGLSTRVLLTYICSNCGSAFPSFLHDALTECKHCHRYHAKLTNPREGVSTEVLAQIMNSFDLYVQYANSEGFGLPQVEAAACGVPVMSIDYSAMSSVIRKIDGTPLRPITKYRELETGCMRAVPDNDFFVDKLIEFCAQPKAVRSNMGFQARKAFEKNYNWDTSAKKWEELFDAAELRSEKETWDSPPNIHEPSREYPDGLDTKTFVDWLIINVLGDTTKLNSYMSSRLVRDLNYGVSTEGHGGTYYNDGSLLSTSPKNKRFVEEDAYKEMLILAERKNYWEKIRSKPHWSFDKVVSR
jgi:glycosyltransferase involved in cell wall biosynthesis